MESTGIPLPKSAAPRLRLLYLSVETFPGFSSPIADPRRQRPRPVILDARNPLGWLPQVTVWGAGLSVLGLWFFRRTIDRAKDFL